MRKFCFGTSYILTMINVIPLSIFFLNNESDISTHVKCLYTWLVKASQFHLPSVRIGKQAVKCLAGINSSPSKFPESLVSLSRLYTLDGNKPANIACFSYDLWGNVVPRLQSLYIFLEVGFFELLYCVIIGFYTIKAGQKHG